MDLWSNPLGTLASAHAVRQKMITPDVNNFFFRLIRGDWWDFEQHVSLLKASDFLSCDYMHQFLRGTWGDNSTDLLEFNQDQESVHFLEGAELLKIWSPINYKNVTL
jgi:hypothetical protein